MNALLERLRHSLRRHSCQPLAYTAVKGLRYVSGLLAAPFRLRRCDVVGARARVRGRLVIENAGRIEIGEDANIVSSFAPVHLTAGPVGRLQIGRNVMINFGAKITARSGVRIGDRVSFGPHVEIDDTDRRGRSVPIQIGDDVWLPVRVRVAAGVTIGSGTVVMAGSVVTESLPPGVIAGGNPAVVVRPRGRTASTAA